MAQSLGLCLDFMSNTCLCVHLVLIALIVLISLCQLCWLVNLCMPRLSLGNSQLAYHVDLLKPQPAVGFTLSGDHLVASLWRFATHQRRANVVTEGRGRAQPESCSSPSTILFFSIFGCGHDDRSKHRAGVFSREVCAPIFVQI